MDVVRHLWLVFVTDGLGLESAPELYQELERALFECQRWAERLAELAEVSIERPSAHRRRVGHRDVRLEEVELIPGVEPWVGFCVVGAGYPEVNPVLLPGRTAASKWVSAAPDASGNLTLVSVTREKWCVRSAWMGDAPWVLIAEPAKEICDDPARHR